MLNPKTVFAKKGAALSKAGGLTAINIVELQNNGRDIFADSYDLGYIHFGLTKKFAELKKEFEDKNGTNYKGNELWDYIVLKAPSLIHKEVYMMPDCIEFVEESNGQHMNVTAWLYLYSDERSFKEFAENASSIAEGYFPLYFNEDEEDTQGEIMLQLPAYYFYLPVSSMENSSSIGVYSQLYSPTRELAFQEIKKAYENAKSPHNINDFSGLNGRKDIIVYDKSQILPKKYAWVMNFIIGSINENRWNNIGKIYEQQEQFPISNATITQGINEAKAIVPSLPITNPQKTPQGNFCGFKIYPQQEGIDKIYSGLVSGAAASKVGFQHLILKSNYESNLLKAEDLCMDVFNRLGKDEKITQKNILNVYNTAIDNFKTDIPANFINVNGINCIQRYVWGVSIGSVGNCDDIIWTRDVTPNNAFSISQCVTPRFGTSKKTLKNNSMTKMFGDKGTEDYGDSRTLPEDKIKSMMVVIQYQPGIFAAAVKMDSKLRGMLGGAQGANAIKKLNEIGMTDRELWQKIILQFGEDLTKHTLYSVMSSSGLNSSNAFLQPEGTYYNICSYGICIIPDSPPVSKKEDLLISNTYNESLNSEISSEGGSTSKYASSRPVIDWTPFTNAGLEKELAGLGKGGRNSIKCESTILKSYSEYFDICTGIKGLSSGKLKKDGNNISAVENKEAEAFADSVDSGNNAHSFKTIFFVGRIPEANKKTKVTLDSFTPTIFASFNKFDLVWDAGYDENKNSRNHISTNLIESKGTAYNLLASSIEAFNTDYNGGCLVSYYYAKGHSQNYNNRWKFGVTATPIKVLRCKQESLQNYASSEYKTQGANAPGYNNIQMAQKFEAFGKDKNVYPGDVIAYSFEYTFPNQTNLKRALNSSGINSLVKTGGWYTEYETLLMADLSIELLPGKNLKEKQWNKINANKNNDFVKERLIGPILKNVFFTSVTINIDGKEETLKGIEGSSANSFSSQSGLNNYNFGLSWLMSPNNSPVYEKTINLDSKDSTTGYTINKVTVRANWMYVSAIPLTKHPEDIQKANRIEFTNNLKHISGILHGTANNEKNGLSNIKYYKSYKGFIDAGDKLDIIPNQHILNYGKGNTLELHVPNSDVNQFHNDWESIIINTTPPPKDNSVDDLILLYNNSELVGDLSVNRLEGGGAQAVDYRQGGSYTLYAIVRRNRPLTSEKVLWKEKVDKSKWSSETIGCFTYATNENGSETLKTTNTVVSDIKVKPNFSIAIKNIDSFQRPGDTLIFKINIPSNIMYLEATFHYRDGYRGINKDEEDVAIENNVWSESWSAKYPDFAVEVNQDFKSVIEKGSCGSQRTVVPNYTIIATQANPFYEGGGGPVTIDTSLGGWTVASGTTSGNRITWYWNGQMAQQSYHITYKERRFPYQSPTFNQEFVFRAHINPEVRYNEKNLNNNYAKANFSVTLDCQGGPTPTEKYDPCTPDDWERLGCKYKYGVGKEYRWNVKFEWSQQNPQKTTSTNVYVAHYMEDVYGSDGNGGSVYLGQREVCPCYCDPSPVTGPNNGKKFWRTEIDGAPLYKEVHDLRIYLKSTNKATQWGWEGASVYDITGSTGYVSGGMMWNVFFDAIYSSDRGSMPRSMYEPFSQPYATGNGGSGCPTCNWLNRWPNPENVAGPRHVRIRYGGLQVIAPKTYYYYYPQQTLANGLVNKHFRWQPISGMIAMTKENTRQTLTVSIRSYAFTGHIYDTWNSVDGTGYSAPGYGWQNRTFHCFCDEVKGTVEFIPARPYIASAVSTGENAQGLDGYVPGKGEKVENRGTGVNGVDNIESTNYPNINNIESNNDQWVY